MQNLLANIGSIITLVLGLIAIVLPAKTESFVSIKAIGEEGKSEVRATYGGFFAAIAIYALIIQSNEIFFVLGLGWLGAASIRLATLFFGSATKKNFVGVVFEAIIGLLCVSNQIF